MTITAWLLEALKGPLVGGGLALTRKGRGDVRVHLRAASFEQARRLCLRLRPDHPDPETFARHGEGQPMADLQHALIDARGALQTMTGRLVADSAVLDELRRLA